MCRLVIHQTSSISSASRGPAEMISFLDRWFTLKNSNGHLQTPVTEQHTKKRNLKAYQPNDLSAVQKMLWLDTMAMFSLEQLLFIQPC